VLKTGSVDIDIDAAGPGTLHAFLYDGEKGYIPVFNSSCAPSGTADDGLSACALTDGSIPAWSPDMSGRVVADVKKTITAGHQVISLPVSEAGAVKIASGGSALVAFQTTQDEVQAFDAPISSVSGPGGTVGGNVPATLSLMLGAPAAFGPFTPGLAKDYFATTPATVTSTAGDATLSVADPSSVATGHLVNGAFSLPSPLQASATTDSTTYANVGSSSNPTPLKTYNGPVSNDPVAISFKQPIAATDALRTGTYSKTLTFTLSTSNP